MLSIRPLVLTDWITLVDHLSEPSITDALPGYLIADKQLWVDTILSDPHAYAIILDHHMIGACRLEKNRHSDFSYWLHSDHRGQGYATQINNKLCRMAISLGWKQIGGTCSPDNTPSQKILLRCGFVETSDNYWLKYL